MATAKKPAKKIVAKTKAKTPAKKRTSKKVQPLRSFRRSPDPTPFVSFQLTKQTVYWSILLIFILVLALWILNLQIDIKQIYDTIDAAQ